MKVLYGLAVAVALIVAPNADAASGSTASPFVGGTPKSLSPLETGSVIARGRMRDGLCAFPPMTSFGAQGLTRSMHISTQVTAACNLIVTETGFADDATEVGAGVANILIDTDGAGPLADTVLEPRQKLPRKGETEFTILEQFNITAYELHLELNALQDSSSGDISGGTLSGYCYVSAFPGNEIKSCYGNVPSRGGDHAEDQAWGHFNNTDIGPDLLLYTDHVITRATFGGLCRIVEGNLPPFWESDCKITRLK